MTIKISQPNRMDRLQDTSGLTALNNGDILYYSGTDWVHLNRPVVTGRLQSTSAGLLTWAALGINNSFSVWNPDIGTSITADSAADTAILTSDTGNILISGTGAGDEIVWDINEAANLDWTGSHVYSKLVYTLSGLDISLPGAGNSKPVFVVDGAAGDPGLRFNRPTSPIGQAVLGTSTNNYHLFDILGGNTGDAEHTSGTSSFKFDASVNTATLSNGQGAFALPQMTTTQRNAMTPADGWMIYNTTTATGQLREAGAWRDL
jgi:hypothetical protein